MRALLLTFLSATAVLAQSPSFFVTDATGSTIVSPLPSPYQFADTPVSSGTALVARATNPSASTMAVDQIFVAVASGSSVQTPNFTVTGVFLGKVLSPNSTNFEDFTVTFTPTVTGPITAVLRVAYQVQQNGCVLESGDPSTQCPEVIADVSTLQGNGTAPILVPTYSGPSGTGTLQPSASSPQLNFGNVSVSATAAFVITLSNQSSLPVTTPAVSLQTQVFGSSAFQLNTATLPATIQPTSSANPAPTFTVTFAPGQIGLTTATLVIGSNSYPLVGTGIVVSGIDALQISYVDKTGVRGLPQAATPISFGQVVSGTNGTATLTFTVANPMTSYDAITVPSLTVSGAAFTLGNAPVIPSAIPPGQSISFQITFTASTTGTYTGTLAIGTRVFSLVGQSVSSPVPDVSLNLDEQPLTSNHQVHLSITLASASPISAIGELTMQFTPSVSGVSDDPAINFTATSGRQLQVTVASGGTTATYNQQAAVTFQTGTTAGTITFTVTFPDKAPVTKEFTIAPEQVQITSTLAVRQAPNLVVTITGFDNTYSAGDLTFNFYDTSGHLISPSPMTVNATSAFHNYFFGTSDVGGAFSLQASFPVLNGNATQIGSVGVAVANSAGSTSASQNFQ